MEVSGQHHARPLYPRERTPVPIEYHAGEGGPRAVLDSYGQERHILPLLRFETLTVQSVTSRYTD
jgi:hypothetical protein